MVGPCESIPVHGGWLLSFDEFAARPLLCFGWWTSRSYGLIDLSNPVCSAMLSALVWYSAFPFSINLKLQLKV